jgi:hypothetical protein
MYGEGVGVGISVNYKGKFQLIVKLAEIAKVTLRRPPRRRVQEVFENRITLADWATVE